VLEQFPEAAFLEFRLRTGRRHQIRIQAWHHGHPLVGERMYRDAAELPEQERARAHEVRNGATTTDLRALLATFPRQALHARRIACLHPATHRRVAFEAELARDIAALVARLREREA
jgi:23S rRNA pseudouridine1911/1915/1917 synthase